MNILNRRPKGQIAVIMTLAVVAVVGSIALGTDVAVMYANWERMQKAVDAAALAGANYLPEDTATASSTAENYAQLNGLAASEVATPSFAPDDSTITVSATRTVPYYFGRVVGLTSQTIQVSATAGAPNAPTQVGGINTMGSTTGLSQYGTNTGDYPLIPIGLDYSTPYTYDQPVTLNQGSVGPGDWGSLALGGVGGSNLRGNIADGYTGPVSVGDWISTEPGVKVGPVDQGMNDRISAGQSIYPSATFSNHTLNDPRAVVLPMVDWSTAQGRSAVLVHGFAMLWIDSVNGGQIQAHFIRQVVPESLGNAQAGDHGARGVPILLK